MDENEELLIFKRIAKYPERKRIHVWIFWSNNGCNRFIHDKYLVNTQPSPAAARVGGDSNMLFVVKKVNGNVAGLIIYTYTIFVCMCASETGHCPSPLSNFCYTLFLLLFCYFVIFHSNLHVVYRWWYICNAFPIWL